MKRKNITKAALVLSILLIFAWIFMGATSSIAWFTADDELVNSLYFGDLDIEMLYKTPSGYTTIDQATKIFSSEALYEPGYTQIVYLKIVNNGTVPFTYEISVVPDTSETAYATSVLGNKIDLADYIKFGLVLGLTEEEVMEKTSDRDIARKAATEKVSDFSVNAGTLGAGKENYAALIIYMPETVANEANYRGDSAPALALGIAARASQLKTE